MAKICFSFRSEASPYLYNETKCEKRVQKRYACAFLMKNTNHLPSILIVLCITLRRSNNNQQSSTNKQQHASSSPPARVTIVLLISSALVSEVSGVALPLPFCRDDDGPPSHLQPRGGGVAGHATLNPAEQNETFVLEEV